MSNSEDINVHVDRAHGDLPDHVDLVVPFSGMPMAHKVRIGGEGELLSDELMLPNDMGKLTQ